MKKVIVAFILLCAPVLANAHCISIPKLINSIRADYGKALFWRYADSGKLKFLMATPRIQGMAGKDAVYHLPWKLYTADDHQACLIGSGDSFQRVKSLEHMDAKRKYGLPGSGYRRCATRDGRIAGVRIWANIELGDSYVYVFSDSHDKGPERTNPPNTEYTVIQAKSLDGWILLNEVNGRSCYKNRGDYWDFMQK